LGNHKKILVLEGEKLAPTSLFSLLTARSGFDVIKMSISCLENLNQPANLQPDVVILEEELLAANMSAVVKLADRLPKIRLIAFNLNNNTLNIFDKHMVQVRQFSDFLELL